MEGDEYRERAVSGLIDEADHLVDDQRGGMALERTGRLAVADEIRRILMLRVVLGGKPVIETNPFENPPGARLTSVDHSLRMPDTAC